LRAFRAHYSISIPTEAALIKKIATILLAAIPAMTIASEPIVNLAPVTVKQVRINDSFWSPKRETNRTASIPHSIKMLYDVGYIRNFELAAQGKREGYSGPIFMDSDAYKVIEAAAYSLATHPDPQLEKQIDEIIDKIAAAQMQDGYLNSWYQVNAPDQRWTDLRNAHELYCAGHLIEAAIAYYDATGKRKLLDTAIKFADYIDSIFGPGKRMGYPGHPEIELALIKLWRTTNNERYFDLARFMIENRGQKYFATEHNQPLESYNGTYWQDDLPIKDQAYIVGHAVRAAYLLCGATDVVARTKDQAILDGIDRIWHNTTEKRTYITGGIGPSAHNEGFTTDYDLPNLTAYQETCASIAMAMWNYRLNLLYGNAKYADYVETALYNGIISGVSLEGKNFFYVNPLESMGRHHRSGWFGCACCPPNVCRTLAAVGQYAYATSDDSIWVNLYIQGGVDVELAGKKVSLDVTTDYPWDGKVVIEPKISSPTRFSIRLRIPGWCDGAQAKVIADNPGLPKVEKGYFIFDRTWKTGDSIELNFPMPVRRVEANPLVKANRGLLALQRGPIVYCFEEIDQPVPLHELSIPASSEFEPEKRPDLLGGVVVLKGTGETPAKTDWTGRLYRTMVPPKKVPVLAIPYYAWQNRKNCPMRVWMPTALLSIDGLAGLAEVTASFTTDNSNPWGANDGIIPASSRDNAPAQMHWWPHKGSEEWVSYKWSSPVKISRARVFWFDDEPRGECRLPASWRLEYKSGTNWLPVEVKSDYPIELSKWCEVTFTPVTTSELRLVVQMKEDFAAGVHEWEVFPD